MSVQLDEREKKKAVVINRDGVGREEEEQRGWSKAD
jgi:hypothetical protein